jgi:3-dehydroquinate synthase
VSHTVEPTRTIVHAAGSYPVYVTVGSLAAADDLIDNHLGDRACFTITDDHVAAELSGWSQDEGHHWRQPDSQPSTRFAQDPLLFPHGEVSKTRGEWQRLSDALLSRGAGRDAAIVAVGGGVVGDLAGFVAATYMRGIPVLHVPTTVVAMVDSALGGKTGVDTAEGKNLIGAFHHPAAVIADPRTLLTLPAREFRAGLAEVVKHAVIADAGYFEWLESHTDDITARNLEVLAELVRRSVAIKADVVESDEREQGRRAHLNLGHTIGHGIEHASGYQLLHGEAVALGLVAECALASDLGLASADLGEQVAALLARFDLPVRLTPGLKLDRVFQAMDYDKKKTGGELRFALPVALGAMVSAGDGWTVAADPTRIQKVLSRLSTD